jgi:von Willebrand factor type A domain
MSQGLTYHIDVVFCIDVTGSMSPVISTVKTNTQKFADDLITKLKDDGKVATQIRARVIAFGDCNVDPNPINASPFYTLLPAEQTSEFTNFVSGLSAAGGGDEPESGLEALAVAMGSDWVQDGDKQRHIIVMFTDASAHPLESRVGAVPGAFASLVPSSLNNLTDGWEGGQQEGGVSTRLKQAARRLLLFAPDVNPWNAIGDAWAQTVFLPSKAGDGLSDVEYKTILEVVANSV